MSETEAPWEALPDERPTFRLTGCDHPDCTATPREHLHDALVMAFLMQLRVATANKLPATVAGATLCLLSIGAAMRHPEWAQGVLALANTDAEFAADFPQAVEEFVEMLPLEVRDER